MARHQLCIIIIIIIIIIINWHVVCTDLGVGRNSVCWCILMSLTLGSFERLIPLFEEL